MRIVLLNAGSSSLKCTLVEADTAAVLARASVDCSGDQVGAAARRVMTEVGALPHTLAADDAIGAVGHRIVHGGDFRSSVRVTSAVRARIAALSELAPLHNPPGLQALSVAEEVVPSVPHVAVFDTAFHCSLPEWAYTYPLPSEWFREWGIRRYGFHGLSHSYCSKRAAAMLGCEVSELRIVVCHLGHGCSAAAVLYGSSLDTTMGFTPMDGLMMATRSGAIDPGILTYVQASRGLTARDIESALNHRAGLLGVSGVSADMREVLAAARDGHDRARLAVDAYVHRVKQAIGALTVTLGGLDVLVFTAGVGEHSPEIRAKACQGLECLGVELDVDLNQSCRPDADIAKVSSRARVLVIATREDQTMLSEVIRVLES